MDDSSPHEDEVSELPTEKKIFYDMDRLLKDFLQFMEVTRLPRKDDNNREDQTTHWRQALPKDINELICRIQGTHYQMMDMEKSLFATYKADLDGKETPLVEVFQEGGHREQNRVKNLGKSTKDKCDRGSYRNICQEVFWDVAKTAQIASHRLPGYSQIPCKAEKKSYYSSIRKKTSVGPRVFARKKTFVRMHVFDQGWKGGVVIDFDGRFALSEDTNNGGDGRGATVIALFSPESRIEENCPLVRHRDGVIVAPVETNRCSFSTDCQLWVPEIVSHTLMIAEWRVDCEIRRNYGSNMLIDQPPENFRERERPKDYEKNDGLVKKFARMLDTWYAKVFEKVTSRYNFYNPPPMECNFAFLLSRRHDPCSLGTENLRGGDGELFDILKRVNAFRGKPEPFLLPVFINQDNVQLNVRPIRSSGVSKENAESGENTNEKIYSTPTLVFPGANGPVMRCLDFYRPLHLRFSDEIEGDEAYCVAIIVPNIADSTTPRPLPRVYADTESLIASFDEAENVFASAINTRKRLRISRWRELESLIAKIQGPFAIKQHIDMSTASWGNLQVKIDGEEVGTLRALDVAKIESMATVASFGRGSEAVTDPSYRDALDVTAARMGIRTRVHVEESEDNISLDVVDVPEIPEEELTEPKLVGNFLKDPLEYLPWVHQLAPRNFRFKARFYKLHIYRRGGKFNEHVDTSHGSGHLATLVVILPTGYTGGELVVKHGSKQVVIGGGGGEGGEQYADAVCFYTDCHHQILPVRSGTRIALQWDLYVTEFEDTEKIVFWRRWLGDWRKRDKQFVEGRYVKEDAANDETENAEDAGLDEDFEVIESGFDDVDDDVDDGVGDEEAVEIDSGGDEGSTSPPKKTMAASKKGKKTSSGASGHTSSLLVHKHPSASSSSSTSDFELMKKHFDFLLRENTSCVVIPLRHRYPAHSLAENMLRGGDQNLFETIKALCKDHPDPYLVPLVVDDMFFMGAKEDESDSYYEYAAAKILKSSDFAAAASHHNTIKEPKIVFLMGTRGKGLEQIFYRPFDENCGNEPIEGESAYYGAGIMIPQWEV